jgi:hypothetical protein
MMSGIQNDWKLMLLLLVVVVLLQQQRGLWSRQQMGCM